MAHKKPLRVQWPTLLSLKANCYLDGGCWIWRGYTASGYAVYHAEATCYRLGRYAWELKHGRPMSSKAHMCHTRDCLSRACINPDHIYEGTPVSNVRDAPRRRWRFQDVKEDFKD